MRLSKLKLAGFKSFVDPTTVHFPSNLTGVVGPNGCGKSNIIDAVRWVMGEISAKHLRGSEAADVIFNGSGNRKPVSAASVELVFDNTDGVISGPYAAYAEVSLKRVVGRDGQSSYYINGARCRRKDITQLFLGTGLGSRSYAIIEQGMISRLIEAKPDDLRAFLEEAAGISKYKERRRETENRIAQTRENLERLNDLRDELEKQINRLTRQAQTARRYQTLKEEERKLRAESLALRLRDLDGEAQTRESAARDHETGLQAAMAALRACEAAIEHAREAHASRSESLNEVQGRYYQIGAEATRAQQAIQHARELRARQRADLDQADAERSEAAALLGRDLGEIDELSRAVAELEPRLLALKAAEAESRRAFETSGQEMQAWQSGWESFSREVADANQKAMVERARIEQLEGRLRRSLAQQEKVVLERDQLAAGDRGRDLDALSARVQAAHAELREAQAALAGVQSAIDAARVDERRLQGEADGARTDAQRLRGQLVSAEALQEAALGTVKGQVVQWLAGQGLGSRPRLAQRLSVDAGWERAVETVLGGYLEAVCVPGLDPVAPLLDGLKAGNVSFVTDSEAGAGSPAHLSSRVRGPAALTSLLGSVRAVEHLDEALRLRGSLQSGESVITRDGVWLGEHWLRVSRGEDPHAGVIEREKELRAMREALAAADTRQGDSQAELERARAQIKELDGARDGAQSAVNRLHRGHVEAQGAHDSLRARADQAAERLLRLAHEAEELAAEIGAAEDETRQARARLEAAVEVMRGLEDRRPGLEEEREGLRSAQAAARARAEADRTAAQDVAIQVESRRSALASLQNNLVRVESRIAALTSRRDDLAAQLAAGEEPLRAQEARLEEWLAQRLAVEKELAGAREALEGADVEFRAREGERLAAENGVETTRIALNTATLAAQETRIRRESVHEQFVATKFELASLLETLDANVVTSEWEAKLAEISERIERLGQVNLAAIDELREQTERKDYLDRQFTDLMEALNTLEQAIRKIDKETRTRFQDTFDRVNGGLQQKFPRLFGGGQAYLEMTGEDVLSAGVAVMARPPGKRNVTISQLSGGEKALTAVALVFSIFELNPAPFCLLDEVDAPLDEHNVGRFCEIVREMSERVQFLFITHNKGTMELASQLLGVTMTEPGVSRLVAVDVDEAMRLAGT